MDQVLWQPTFRIRAKERRGAEREQSSSISCRHTQPEIYFHCSCFCLFFFASSLFNLCICVCICHSAAHCVCIGKAGESEMARWSWASERLTDKPAMSWGYVYWTTFAGSLKQIRTHTHITITHRPSLPLFSSLWKAIDRCWSASKKVICLTFEDTSLYSPLKKKKNLFLPSLCCLATCSLCWPVFGIDELNYFTFNVGTISLLGRERKNYK